MCFPLRKAGESRRAAGREATLAGAAPNMGGWPGRPRCAAAVVTGEGLASIGQGPDPAGADSFAACVAIDEAGPVAAVRAHAARPVEFAGVIGILPRCAAGPAARAGLTAGAVALVDPGDLEPVRRA